MVIGSTRLIIVAAAGTSTPRFAYVTNLSDDTLSIYSVNPSTGQLRPHGYVLTDSHPDAVSLDPSGKFARSEEHTSELQSHLNLVCRLLLEKKKHAILSP